MPRRRGLLVFPARHLTLGCANSVYSGRCARPHSQHCLLL